MINASLFLTEKSRAPLATRGWQEWFPRFGPGHVHRAGRARLVGLATAALIASGSLYAETSSATVSLQRNEAATHWAFQSLKKIDPPKVHNEAWAKTPIDKFILAKLEARDLSPAPPADKRTLIRRASFDLLGLPPTPEEIDAFLADSSSDAFARVIDRLLDSPHYGERWGRHWLDVVRYAETTANDANAVMRYAWRYRDYVVAACNADKPYDQFVVEQLAGDLMPPTGDLSRD